MQQGFGAGALAEKYPEGAIREPQQVEDAWLYYGMASALSCVLCEACKRRKPESGCSPETWVPEGRQALDANPTLQDALRGKGTRIMAAAMLLNLLVIPALLLCLGYGISQARGGRTCGRFQELALPACANLSWEFVLGVSTYIMAVVCSTFFVYYFLIHSAKGIKRRRAECRGQAG